MADKKKIIIPNSYFKLYRSKLSINKSAFDQNKASIFGDKNTEYIFKFPNTTSDMSIINSEAYFYDSFKIKGDLTLDCNQGHLGFKINPLTQADNHYPWTGKFDFLDTKKLNIQNAGNVYLDIAPTIYHIGKVPHFSPLPLKEITISARHIESKLSAFNNLETVKIILSDKQISDDTVRNYSHFEFSDCKNLKVVDFSEVGKNNYLDIYVDNKTNQDLVFKFNKNQIFTPCTLATFLHMNNGFTKAYFNEYKITDLLDIKNPDNIIEVKYSELNKKITKKYPKIVEEVIKGEIKQSGPVR